MTATWTTPRTYTTGEILTASIFNQYVRDEFDWLKTPTESGNITWATAFTTTSTSYVDVTGVTTTLTTNGGGLDVWLRFGATSSGASQQVTWKLLVDGVDQTLLGSWSPDTTTHKPFQFFYHIPALAAGSHTIKVQVKWNGGANTLTMVGTANTTTDPEYFVREAGA